MGRLDLLYVVVLYLGGAAILAHLLCLLVRDFLGYPNTIGLSRPTMIVGILFFACALYFIPGVHTLRILIEVLHEDFTRPR